MNLSAVRRKGYRYVRQTGILNRFLTNMETSNLPVIHFEVKWWLWVFVATNNLLRILFSLETRVETKILLKFGIQILSIEFRGYADDIDNTEGG